MMLVDSTYVVATNAAIVWGGIRICCAWLPWVVRGWSELRQQALGLLPLSIVWLVAWLALEGALLALEGAYRGTACTLADFCGEPYNALVWTMRGAILVGMVAHIVPKWLADGHSLPRVRRMSARFGAELLAVWLVVAWLLG